VANNNPYNVKTELTDGIDSMARFSGLDGGLHPQRLALHELIVQRQSVSVKFYRKVRILKKA